MGGRRLALEKGGVLEPGVLRPTTTALRLADMDRDGVDATVMYGPIVPLLVEDPELRRVCYRAYNDWLAEFCASAPERLVGAGLIPIDDPKSAADEVRHLKQLAPAHRHVPGGQREGAAVGRRLGAALGGGAPRRASSSASTWAAGCARSPSRGPRPCTAGNMGVRVSRLDAADGRAAGRGDLLGRARAPPDLKIVLAETGIGWLPYMLERLDDTYDKFLDAAGVLEAQRRARAHHGAEPLLQAAGLGHVPDGSRRAAPAGRPRRRPGDVGLRLPARRQHVAGVAEGHRGQLQGRARRLAPSHPLRQRAARSTDSERHRGL